MKTKNPISIIQFSYALILIFLINVSCNKDKIGNQRVKKEYSAPVYGNTQNKINGLDNSKNYKTFFLKKDKNYFESQIKNFNQLNSFKSKTLSLYDTGSIFSVFIQLDNSFIISKNNFRVTRFNNSFTKKLNSFGQIGRGPGEGTFINAFTITNNHIILYDSHLRKIVCYTLDGILQYEKLLKGNTIPYHINSMKQVSENLYLATGISMNEWKSLNQGKTYNNIYLLRINPINTEIELLDSKSILPINIINAIKTKGMIASTVSSPFKLVQGINSYFLFNISSSIVFKLNIIKNHIVIKSKIKLGDIFFKKHPEISENDFTHNTKKSKKWLSNGNFFINIFENNSHIFFYLSKVKNNKPVYELIVVNKNNFVVSQKILIENHKIIRNIDNEKMYFFSFDDSIHKYEFSSVSLDELIKL